MSELPATSPFGPVEITPEQGITLQVIELSEKDIHKRFVLFKKQDNGFGAINGIFEMIENKDGKIVMKSVLGEEGDPKVRRALAHAIVKANKDEIMRQSVIVAEEALARKSTGKLKQFFKAKQKGGKLKLSSHRGCVTFCIGEEATIL